MPKGSNKLQKWNILQNNGLMSSTRQGVQKGTLSGSKRRKRHNQVQCMSGKLVQKKVFVYWENLNKEHLIQQVDGMKTLTWNADLVN